MNRKNPLPYAASAAAVLAVALGAVALTGCASDPADDIPLTQADAARIEAENVKEKQAMLARAEELIQDGEAEKARGEAMADQGNTVEGNPMIAGGKAKIAQGEALMDRANEMETSVEPVRVTTSPSR